MTKLYYGTPLTRPPLKVVLKVMGKIIISGKDCLQAEILLCGRQRIVNSLSCTVIIMAAEAKASSTKVLT